VKQTAERIYRETLAAIDIPAAVERKLARIGSTIVAGDSRIDLLDFDSVVAIAFGKASYAVARGLVNVLSPDFHPDGILVVPAALPAELPGWRIFRGGHPLPNSESFAAGRAILERLAACDERTLVFFLISGGGSSMVEQPIDPELTLADIDQVNEALITCGAPIDEINTIRKHLSATKGGRLAATAPFSRKLTLAISDVPAGHESALASGPTLPDPTTIHDAGRIGSHYQLIPKFPPILRHAFENHRLRETPKSGHPAFRNAHFEVLLGAHDLTHAAHHACEAEGYVCVCDNSTDNWALEKAADFLLAQLAAHSRANPGRRVAVICEGEVSSPVTGNGMGGRNAAFVLACAPRIAGKGITVLSAGTDGIDGNSQAAGAIADGDTLPRARALGIDIADFQRRSDSYNFFARLDDAIVTGPTGNNLRDLRILLAEPGFTH
jgi:hydroxypyruvate reductase